MNDERYQGVVRGIVTKKAWALDYAEDMARYFIKAREQGYAASLTTYAVYFDSKCLLTPKEAKDVKEKGLIVSNTNKKIWHPTQVTILLQTDSSLIAKYPREIAKFDDKAKYFTSRQYRHHRKLSDEDWSSLRIEYVSGLEGLIKRAKVIAAAIRGDPAPPQSEPEPTAVEEQLSLNLD